jgi:hypothetical protein
MRLLPSVRIASDRGRGALTPSARATVAGRSTARAGAALGAVAAIALAGCAVAHPAAKTTGSTGTAVTSKRSTARPAAGPEQRAEADADAILASFAVPSGARKLAVAPSVDKGALKTPIQIPATPDLVDKADWWLAPGKPQQVLAWEAKHVSHRYSLEGTGSSTRMAGSEPIWADMFSLPNITGVLDSRELVVQVVQDGAKTAIRVDAQVTWQPAVPASEKVPAAAKAVTISMDLGMNQGGKRPPKPVTITDPAKVGELRALINSLPLSPPGMFSCPAAFGDNLVLTFRAHAGGPALAVATDMLSGCGGVDLTIGGKSQPELAGVSGPRILKIAGLSWKIPTLRAFSCQTRASCPGKSSRLIASCGGFRGRLCCKKSA